MARRNKLQILRDLVDDKKKQAETLFPDPVLKKLMPLFNQITKKIDDLNDDRQKVIECVGCGHIEKVYFFAPNKQECPKCDKWMVKVTKKSGAKKSNGKEGKKKDGDNNNNKD